MTQDRVATLKSLQILDTEREPEFDEIVEFAARLCEAPVALISLVDEQRQWFKAEVGLGVRSTPIGQSICAHAIEQNGVLIVEDTLEDPRFCDNVLCTNDPKLRFYAGAVLRMKDGLAIGTLCVLDRKPRRLTEFQVSGLRLLANQVVAQLALRRAIAQVPILLAEIDHRVKNSLALVSGFLSLQARNSESLETRAALELASARVITVAELHELIHRASGVGDVDLKQFLHGLWKRLKANAPAGISLELDAAKATVSAQQASSIGILVNELVTNCYMHAFSDRGGRVTISTVLSGCHIAIEVADDGSGYSGKHSDRKGTGSRVIDALSRHLGGSVERRSDSNGTFVRVCIPQT